MGKYTDLFKLTRDLLSEPQRAVAIYRDFKHNKAAGIFTKVASEEIIRASVQISDWREALDQWESATTPDRYKMMELYQEIELDDQVTAKVSTVKKKINATEYYFFDTVTEKENKKIIPTFDKRWFMKFLNLTIDAEFYGHSLIQFGDWNLNTGYVHRQIELVPRHLVSPEMGIVKHNTGDQDGTPYRTGEFARFLVEIGDTYGKGLFAALAPPFIFKKNAMSFWSDFQQRYGEPMITFNTDITNKENVERLEDFIMNRGRNAGAVMDYNEVATLLEAEKTDAFRVYHEMILLNNDSISKGIEGQTLTTDSDSGKFTGDVHADTALLFHLGRLKSIRYYINDELLPKMRKDGFPILETEEFRWREIKDIDAIVNRLIKLALYYEIEPELIYELTGIQVGDRVEQESVDGRNTNTKRTADKNDGE